MPDATGASRKFFVEVIKPSHYDDDGYVIQWRRAFIPSNSLAVLYSLADDLDHRHVLGDDVEIVTSAYDETHTNIPTKKIINRIQGNDGRGLVMLVGVQTNQFPRAADLAREFRAAGIQVIIGGFHVSGTIAMLSETPVELQEMLDAGVSLFAGEAEGRLGDLLQDAYRNELKPVYNYLGDLPDLSGHPAPLPPSEVARRSFNFAVFDAGRGCPFQCSFCTIINVQGRKSRYRDADDVERFVRAAAAKGVRRLFITDDNIARNKNWEPIFDRLIELRENEGIRLKLFMQVDTLCHKIPNFIEKATRAGCNRCFIGLESVNPENLAAVGKTQNRISEYRTMLQKWRDHGVLTSAGFIVGFPADTPESIERDIKLIQEELPVDVLEFFILTPLPGSADHRDLYEQGAWLAEDLNFYDSEHTAQNHERMTEQEWVETYHRAWDLYYTPEHVERMMRRAKARGCGMSKMLTGILLYHGAYRFEKLHPLQCGVMRRKNRRTCRPTFKRENPLLFYPHRAWEMASTNLRLLLYYLKLDRLKKRINRDPDADNYTDLSLTPPEVEESPEIEVPRAKAG